MQSASDTEFRIARKMQAYDLTSWLTEDWPGDFELAGTEFRSQILNFQKLFQRLFKSKGEIL